jgi:hypothetical protein
MSYSWGMGEITGQIKKYLFISCQITGCYSNTLLASSNTLLHIMDPSTIRVGPFHYIPKFATISPKKNPLIVVVILCCEICVLYIRGGGGGRYKSLMEWRECFESLFFFGKIIDPHSICGVGH